MRRIRRLGVAELLFYAIVAIAATWPVSRRIDTAIPLGTEPVATVPMFNVWTVWWNANRAQHFYAGYWDAPIFFPAEDTFAMSETQPLSVAAAPVLWATGSRAAAYNTYLLLVLALNGWSAFHLLRHLEFNWLAALLAGLLVAVLPFVHWKLGLLQCVPLCGIVWTVHASLCFGDKPTWLRGASVGLAFAATYYFCNYYGLFWSVLLLIGGAWLLGFRLFQWRAWPKLLFAVALAAALICPFALVQRQSARQHNWERKVDLVSGLSAKIGDYTGEPVKRLSWPNYAEPDRRERWPLGTGYACYSLALVGLAVGLADRKRRRWTLFCFSLLASAVVLSMGPEFAIGSWSPYQTLMGCYPGFKFIRSPYRFAVFAQLAVALSAGAGLHYAMSLAARWRLKRLLPVATALVLGIGTSASIWPREPAIYETPRLDENRRWITWLRDETPAKSAIVCVPFVSGSSAAGFADTTIWMYYGTYHKRTLASGYSGYFPESFFDLQRKMKGFPDRVSLECLAQYGIDYCVVRHGASGADSIWRWPRNLRRVFSDEQAGVDIYQIVNLPSGPDSKAEARPFR